MRAVVADPDSVTVSGLERMAVFANMPGRVTSFLLARVSSASAGATLRVTLFDVGDALAPLAIGAALGLLYLLAQPVTNASLTPAPPLEIRRRLATCSTGWCVGPSSPRPMESCVNT